MRKFLVFDDGTRCEIPPLSYTEFKQLSLWVGASDLGYARWLHHNNFHEPDSFNGQALATSQFEIHDGEPTMEFEIEEGIWAVLDIKQRELSIKNQRRMGGNQAGWLR